MTAGGAIFSRLRALGVDYVFANSGTDFPPIIEGLAEAAALDIDLPKPLVIPHEHAAMGMAHGYYLISGKAQAVMLHTNVGLANGAIGAINAACEQVPMILMSGRTPVTEKDRFGARTVPIGWGQEMRDQNALVREACKWEYELKFPEQIAELLDRAYAIANSTPKGPVYMALPRETLCESTPVETLEAPPSMAPSAGQGDPAAIEAAAELLAGATNPLVIAQRGAGDAEGFAAFAEWAEEWAIAVCSYWATHLAIDTDHPCHVGADPGPWMAEADVVVILDSLAPWWPDKHHLKPAAKVINIGPDPLYSRFPVRNFPSDITIAGENRLTVPALIAAMDGKLRDETVLAARRERLAAASQAEREAIVARAAEGNRSPCTKAWVSHCLGEALAGRESAVFSELGSELGPLSRSGPLSWFQEPHSGGLGWSFPAALGAKLADPDRISVATLGDGSYMFANPTVCHQIAEALDLPVIVIILNNGEWHAVRRSVMGLYPDGYAAKANEMPLTALTPSPDFTKTAEASRAWAETVTDGADVPAAIERAITVATEEGRHALLNIMVQG
jgi:acetolactate synthase-1/2/3 large subunit